MRDPEQHILYIATEYAAGMRPYANAIIHTLWQAGDHAIIVAKDDDVKHDFDDLDGDSVTWVDYPTSKLRKLAFRFHPTRLLKLIEQVVVERGIRLIYCLTGELILVNHIKRLQQLAPMLYTVHDAVGHDSKFDGWGTWLKHQILIDGPRQRLIRNTNCQITNSYDQQRLISERYPYHKVYYAPFPTLVTDDIAHGTDTVPETRPIADGYILFFGNLQLYKGVHLLYDAYMTHPGLQTRHLVIAGAGHIYFKRQTDEKGVTFVNRYIDDSELNDLFSRAAVVVYPYISATQSGVTSIASYFDKPMVLSDLPFFKQACEGIKGVEFFPSGDSLELIAAIDRALMSTDSTRPLYERLYAPEAMLAALEGVIQAACGVSK